MIKLILAVITLNFVTAVFVLAVRHKVKTLYQAKDNNDYSQRIPEYYTFTYPEYNNPLPVKESQEEILFYLEPETEPEYIQPTPKKEPEPEYIQPDSDDNFRILDSENDIIREENMVSGMPGILEQVKLEWNQRIRLVGTQNTGKTTLALWIVQSYKDAGAHVIVLDSHNQMPGPANNHTGKWPVSEIYGTCNNYTELEDKAGGLITLIEQRLNDVGMGKVKERGADPLLLIVAEEMFDMMASCGENMKTLKRKLMSVARKGNIDYLEISQTDRATAAGMKGAADMNTFDLDIKLKLINGERTCCAGKEFYSLPGKYTLRKVTEKKTVLGDSDSDNTGDAARIADLWKAGKTVTEISIAVFGNKNSRYNNQIREILRQSGINPEAEKLKKMPYPEYLKSEHWQNTRKRKLEESGHKCQVCGSTERLEVHHNSYENRGNESMQDLIVLCHEHHSMFHGKN